MPVRTKKRAFLAFSSPLLNARQNSTASSAASSSVSFGDTYAAIFSKTPRDSHASLRSNARSMFGLCASANRPSASSATSVPGGCSERKQSSIDESVVSSPTASLNARHTEGHVSVSPANRATLRATFKPSASRRESRRRRNDAKGFPFSRAASASAHRASAERFKASPATIGHACSIRSASGVSSSASRTRSVPAVGDATAKKRRRRASTLRLYSAASATRLKVFF